MPASAGGDERALAALDVRLAKHANARVLSSLARIAFPDWIWEARRVRAIQELFNLQAAEAPERDDAEALFRESHRDVVERAAGILDGVTVEQLLTTILGDDVHAPL